MCLRPARFGRNEWIDLDKPMLNALSDAETRYCPHNDRESANNPL